MLLLPPSLLALVDDDDDDDSDRLVVVHPMIRFPCANREGTNDKVPAPIVTDDVLEDQTK